MDDNFFIRRCFELAKMGAGKVSPNPLVGAVIVKNDEIISEGYHEYYGGPHAEVNAIKNCNLEDFFDCSIYVSLEPCTHFGKTPPCCDLLIHKKFKEVIFASTDPNPEVSGKSILKLKENNINVRYGILENEANYLNRFFFKHISNKLPWIILKYAQSRDGFISKLNQRTQISNIESQTDTHKLRSEIDAILIGKITAAIDNPKLNVRLVEGRNPLRIVLDKNLELDLSLDLFSDELANKTLVIYNKFDEEKLKYFESKNIKAIKIDLLNNQINLNLLLIYLGSIGISSILVEGGYQIHKSFIENDLVDEIIEYTSPIKLENGLNSIKPLINNFKIKEEINLNNDIKRIYLKN